MNLEYFPPEGRNNIFLEVPFGYTLLSLNSYNLAYPITARMTNGENSCTFQSTKNPYKSMHCDSLEDIAIKSLKIGNEEN